ncbi:MAG: hypothetical protein AAFQ81_18970, partial [Pseudomonadota bacterium]
GSVEEADAVPPPEPPSPAHREPTRPIPVDQPEAAPRRELDPDVRDVLREEAARESELRRRDVAMPDHQDEMALSAAPDPASDEDDVSAAISGLIADAEDIGELQDAPRERARDEAASRYSADPNLDPVEAQIAAAAAGAGAGAGSRRDLLPDIEEINSTLRATETRSASDPNASDIDTMVERPRRRTGTRIGFAVAILIFAGLIAIYANAPRISAAVPQAEPVLQAYVTQVDRLRLWIDDIAQGALTSDDAALDASVEPDTAPAAPDTDTATEAAAAPPVTETAEDGDAAGAGSAESTGN